MPASMLAALALTLAGTVLLLYALVPVGRLIERLAGQGVRRWWRVLQGLMLVFVAGYLLFAAMVWRGAGGPLAIVVSVVFFLGACFVWLVNTLSLATADALERVAVLERESVTDPLTGLFNRRHLERRLAQEVLRARRHGLPLSVLLLDVDRFKRINDRHGHPAGDHVLRALAGALQGVLRESDLVARYGGDELIVVAPHTGGAEALALAERVREAAGQARLEVPGLPGLTVSVGVAELGAGDGAGELVAAADAALYRAKRLGRDRVMMAASATMPSS